jgi:hypothetical protein
VVVVVVVVAVVVVREDGPDCTGIYDRVAFRY